MSKSLKRLSLILFLTSLIVSCSEEPANESGAKETPVSAEVGLKGPGTGAAGNVDAATIKNNPFNNPAINFDKAILENPEVFSAPGENEGVGSVEEQKLKDFNLRQPIVYGIGAGGITMDTTYEESKTLLTPPLRGPFEDGSTLYNEQLFVRWKQEGKRKPQMIVPTGGYLGAMEAGAFGELTFQTKFLNYWPDQQQGAVRLIQDLYLELEKVSDTSYNCLETGRCRLIYGDVNQANFVMVLPGAIFLMAKEEFQIAEVRIVRDVDPGMLNNNLDVLTGDIRVPEQDPFQLGQSFGEIFDRLEASPVKATPEVYLNPDSLVYAWNGVYLIFHRSNYSVEVTAAEAADKNMMTQVTPAFGAYLTLGGSRILMTQTADDISFARETLPNPATMDMDIVNLSETEVEVKMTMNMKIRKQDSKLFAKRFAEFLASELSGRYDVVRHRMWGYQNEAKVNKEIFVSIEAYNSDSLQGVDIGFEVNEEQEKFNYFTVGKKSPEFSGFSKVTLPASSDDVARVAEAMPVLNSITNGEVLEEVPNPNYEKEMQNYLTVLNQVGQEIIVPEKPKKTMMVPKMELRKPETFRELVGVKLNDLVKLEQIDALGRGEATATFLSASPEAGEVKERVSYSDQKVFYYPFFNRPFPRQQGSVNFSGASLGLQVIGGDTETQYARVVSVTSGAFYGVIRDICGLDETSPIKIAMKDTEVVAALDAAIAKQKALDPKYDCDHFKFRDDGSLGVLKQIYFPEQQLTLEFSNRALSAVTIHMPLSEADMTMPEVMK